VSDDRTDENRDQLSVSEGQGLLLPIVACLIVVGCFLAQPFLGKYSAAIGAFVLLVFPLATGTLSRFRLRKFLLGLLDGGLAILVFISIFIVVVWQLGRLELFDGGSQELFKKILACLALTAIPEELFFRGFLQRRVALFLGTKKKLAGFSRPLALLIVAAVFALVHVLAFRAVGALLVFFPALVFGQLWNRRESVAGGVLFHAACNLSLLWVNVSFY
jgi:membrane protease YdiL (CAAX protease family)